MRINTFTFGELEVDDSLVIRFEHGIPGFEHLKQYTIVQTESDSPFRYLQSVDDGDVTFIITNPFVFFQDYEFDLPESTISELKIANEKDVDTWCIVTFNDNIGETTMNVMAPVIINNRENLGKQIILHDSGYVTRHKLFQEAPAEPAGSRE